MQMVAYQFFAHTRIPGPTEARDMSICGLIEHRWMLILEYAEENGDLVNIDRHKQRWLSTCGQLAAEHQRKACKCGRKRHNLYDASTNVWSPDMYRYIREVLLKWPHLALCKRRLWSHAIRAKDRSIAHELKYRSPLEAAVGMRRGSEYEIPHLSMISQLLDAGCDPNQIHVRALYMGIIYCAMVARSPWERQNTRDACVHRSRHTADSPRCLHMAPNLHYSSHDQLGFSGQALSVDKFRDHSRRMCASKSAAPAYADRY
jgi:hypothetical protein